ncbi:hypothetical protein V494_04701 [Pseudogymnoascus sp. VKM F-4513 (FW-928)]|nr:hypothetical protein V494_04701 [Pseudogymnoascus sp. VKM F-4513 (FW-928)]
MTPTPAEYEITRRPVWDPAPGTACLWHCITHKPLAMHRLSDRALGGLYIAIDCGLIRKSNCDINESDVGESFKIRVAVVSIPVHRQRGTFIFELRGAGKTNAKLPAIVYNTDVFKARYPNWAEWLDELLYRQGPDGTIHVEEFDDYPRDDIDDTPPDWPRDLTRDRELASEAHYRLKNLNTKTGLPKNALNTEDNVHNPHTTRSQNAQPTKSNPITPQPMLNSSGTSGKGPSIAEMIDGRYSFKGGNQTSGNAMALADSEDEIVTRPRLKKRKASTLPEAPKRRRQSSPTIAPIEVHKAVFQAAFRDKSVQRSELFHALLPHITVADAEEILLHCQKVAATISESKFE